MWVKDLARYLARESSATYRFSINNREIIAFNEICTTSESTFREGSSNPKRHVFRDWDYVRATVRTKSADTDEAKSSVLGKRTTISLVVRGNPLIRY